jgi:hypothetical protein
VSGMCHHHQVSVAIGNPDGRPKPPVAMALLPGSQPG